MFLAGTDVVEAVELVAEGMEPGTTLGATQKTVKDERAQLAAFFQVRSGLRPDDLLRSPEIRLAYQRWVEDPYPDHVLFGTGNFPPISLTPIHAYTLPFAGQVTLLVHYQPAGINRVYQNVLRAATTHA